MEKINDTKELLIGFIFDCEHGSSAQIVVAYEKFAMYLQSKATSELDISCPAFFACLHYAKIEILDLECVVLRDEKKTQQVSLS